MMTKISKIMSAYEQQLDEISFLGRIEPLKSINLLYELLHSRTTTYQNFLTIGRENTQENFVNGAFTGNYANVFQLLEEIHWLFLILGHLVADSPKGEIPTIPEPIEQLSVESPTGTNLYLPEIRSYNEVIDSDPVVRLFWIVFVFQNLTQQNMNSNRMGYMSPLLSKTEMWFLERWAPSYLMSYDTSLPISRNLALSYGKGPITYIIPLTRYRREWHEGFGPHHSENCFSFRKVVWR